MALRSERSSHQPDLASRTYSSVLGAGEYVRDDSRPISGVPRVDAQGEARVRMADEGPAGDRTRLAAAARAFQRCLR
jgi:hypothetical protein